MSLDDFPHDWCPPSLITPLRYWQRFTPVMSDYEWTERDDGASAFLLAGWQANFQPDCDELWIDDDECLSILRDMTAIARYESHQGRCESLNEHTAPLACYFRKGTMVVLWPEKPCDVLRGIPEHLMGLQHQGSDAVIHIGPWDLPPKPSGETLAPRAPRPGPSDGLYTIDQLRKAWGAGAWAARRGRA